MPEFGLTVSISKTNFFAAGGEATNLDNTPLLVSCSTVDAVDVFPYLGSTIAKSGKMDCEVERWPQGPLVPLGENLNFEDKEGDLPGPCPPCIAGAEC